ncbi:hypothetical protein L9F63_003769, partial [Diploptera punctata]
GNSLPVDQILPIDKDPSTCQRQQKSSGLIVTLSPEDSPPVNGEFKHESITDTNSCCCS